MGAAHGVKEKFAGLPKPAWDPTHPAGSGNNAPGCGGAKAGEQAHGGSWSAGGAKLQTRSVQCLGVERAGGRWSLGPG